jgi:hypothetical protein
MSSTLSVYILHLCLCYNILLGTDCQTLCSTNQLLMLNGTLFTTSWTSVFRVGQK